MQRYFILLCSLLATAVAQDNSTNSPPTRPDCNLYNTHCNNNGVCQSDGTCRYFGLANTNRGGSGDDCPYSVFSVSHLSISNLLTDVLMVPGAEGYITQVRIFEGVIFSVLTILSLYRLGLEILIQRNNHKTDYITTLTLLLLNLFSLFNLIQCIDYWGMYGRMSYTAIYVTFMLKDVLMLVLFSALLFHWAELYYSAIRKLRREQMLAKLKPGYEGSVTIEEILLKINFISKFRFAFLLISILSIVCYFEVRELHVKDQTDLMNQVYQIIAWVLFSVGYGIYGYRLLQILPPVLRDRIKAIMILLGIFAVAGTAYCCLILGLLYVEGQGLKAILNVFAFASLEFIAGFATLNIFLPMWQWHKWFNPKLIKSMTSKTGSTNSGGKSMDVEMNLENLSQPSRSADVPGSDIAY
ncbi:hypothetical protein PROFUN_13132 [Planoprotostelium fungivorum]|uniref:THH1/TOM1/TOM3 domain-containing protein n=1 Tax=Planoprotostelium fungivorum TaxID=1890364 RepID=A0A2P6N530_9EUKA|nr:hypothetical protein PROFUN_13132 [Planoprotostelium fungivorum]